MEDFVSAVSFLPAPRDQVEGTAIAAPEMAAAHASFETTLEVFLKAIDEDCLSMIPEEPG
jgi:hypothetical protein